MGRRIYKWYRYFYPFADERCKSRGRQTLLLAMLPVAAAWFYGSMNVRNGWNCVMMLWMAVFLEAELAGMLYWHEEEQMYAELSQIVARIRHQYYCFGNVADAVYFAAEGLRKDLRLHLQELYRVLTSPNRADAEREYQSRVKNPLYRMLLLQLCIVYEYGDEEGAEGSMFLNHLTLLQKEAEGCIRSRRRKRHLCAGLGMITAMPVLCTNWMEMWAVGNLLELQSFYYGWQGWMIKLAGLLLSIMIYAILLYIRWLRPKEKEEEVMEFYFVIRLLRGIPGMSVQELTGQLEQNAVVFKKELRRCMREMEWDEQKAFLQLREEVKYPPMQRLADLFALTEEAGVAEAFARVETEMQEFTENRQLEQEIMCSRQVEYGTLAACVPGIFFLAFYLIVPFMSECFRQLEEYMQGLNAIM